VRLEGLSQLKEDNSEQKSKSLETFQMNIGMQPALLRT
jgi:hypothetical protein